MEEKEAKVELIYPDDLQFEQKIDRMLAKLHQATNKGGQNDKVNRWFN